MNNPTKIYNQLLKSIFDNYVIESIEENFDAFTIIVKSYENILDSPTQLQQLINDLSERDELECHLINNGFVEQNFYLSNNKEDIDTLFDELKAKQSENYQIQFIVNKKIQNKTLTIFSMEDFINNLTNKSLLYSLDKFNSLITNHEYFYFEVYNIKNSISSSTLNFYPYGTNPNVISKIDERKNILKIRGENCNFYNASTYTLIPDDLYFNGLNEDQHSKIKSFLDKIASIILLVFILDNTKITDSEFWFKLTGYRTFEDTINVTNFCYKSANELFAIYNWSYKEGKTTDKISITRNMISIHFIDKNTFSLDKGIANSTFSAYAIYVKESVKEYLKLRKNISEALISLTKQMSDIIESFIKSFKQSFIAFISFFISALLVNRIKGELPFEVFTLEIALISTTLIIISAIYRHISLSEIKEEEDHYIKSYQELKARYENFIDQEDLNSIFNNDAQYKRDKAYLENKKKWYKNFWTGSLILLLVLTWLCFYLNTQKPQPNSLNTNVYTIKQINKDIEDFNNTLKTTINKPLEIQTTPKS